MKIFVLISGLIFSLGAACQVSGEIAADQRKIATDISYTVPGSYEGVFVFDITVDMDGRIRSCLYRKDLSTVISTPLMVKAKNQVLTGLTFERGYHFPEFHRGTVTISVVPEQ